MISIAESKCVACGLCVRECPAQALIFEKGKARVTDKCVQCLLCSRICPSGAIFSDGVCPPTHAKCDHCPVGCKISEGFAGACRRYRNVRNKLELTESLVVPRRNRFDAKKARREFAISQPIVTGIGAGTASIDVVPPKAPYVVEDKIAGVDAVTVASDTPLSYCAMLAKIETELPIGEEGNRIERDGAEIGMLIMEQYGSKMAQIGGVNSFNKKLGVVAARTIVEIVHGRAVTLKIGDHTLKMQLGKPPTVDGRARQNMKVGCGSGTARMFGSILKEVADEVILLDSQATVVLSEHAVARPLGLKRQGITPRGRKGTGGRYFIEAGQGWGGTNIADPKQAVASIDRNLARPGMRLLIVETTGKEAAMFEIQKDWTLKPIKITPKALKAVNLIAETCEKARFSAMLVGGLGGSARTGVTKYPIKLNEAVHQGRVNVTIGGAPTYILPGGGIDFLVDVEKMCKRRLAWTPTPAVIVPVEYTMEKKIYEKMNGHIESLQRVKKALLGKKIEHIR